MALLLQPLLCYRIGVFADKDGFALGSLFVMLFYVTLLFLIFLLVTATFRFLARFNPFDGNWINVGRFLLYLLLLTLVIGVVDAGIRLLFPNG
jgi:hypothetical protein